MECSYRLQCLNDARHLLESFDASVGWFDSWLCGAESQLSIMQRSVGDLHKLRQQTIDLQVTYTHMPDTQMLTVIGDGYICLKDSHYVLHCLKLR